MKSSILMTACAGLVASIFALPLIRNVHAQEDDGVSAADDYSPEAKKPKPIDIHGCWTGPMSDTISGPGTITFQIKQRAAQILIDTGHNQGSRIDVEYQGGGFFKAPMSGRIKAKSITFNAKVSKTCRANGAASVIDSNDIEGTLDFNCGSGFGHVTYQVAHCG